MVCSAASMAETANQHCRDIAITVDKCAWMSTENLKMMPPLSFKLDSCIVGLFLVLSAIGPVPFQLQLPNDWAIHNVFYVSQLNPAIGVVYASDTPFHPATDNSIAFEVQNILDSHTVNLHDQLICSFLLTGRATLCLKVPGSLGLFYKLSCYSSCFSPTSWIILILKAGVILGLVGVSSTLITLFELLIVKIHLRTLFFN